MTSKPSATNCPKAFECDYFRYVFLMVLLVCDSHLLFAGRRKLSGGYSGGVPPLPIPNREVKPVRADGTAYSGRVGSRRPFRLSAALEKVSPQRRFFLLSVISNISLIFCASQSAAFGWLQTVGLICLKHHSS